jgi:hypothetical protein
MVFNINNYVLQKSTWGIRDIIDFGGRKIYSLFERYRLFTLLTKIKQRRNWDNTVGWKCD